VAKFATTVLRVGADAEPSATVSTPPVEVVESSLVLVDDRFAPWTSVDFVHSGSTRGLCAPT